MAISPIKEFATRHSKTGGETQNRVSSFNMTGFSEGGTLGICECSVMRASISSKGKDNASSETEMIQYKGQ